jgi:hypothetical protein
MAGGEGARTGFFYDGVAAGRDVRAGLSRRSASTRPLPMEDLCFFVKAIDNSRLVRVVDPRSRRECLGLVAWVLAFFVVALLYALPYLAKLRTGYRIEDLKKQHEALLETNRQFQVREAALRDPKRIYAIARGRLGLSSPLPEYVVWPDASRTLQQNRDLFAQHSAGPARPSDR